MASRSTETATRDPGSPIHDAHIQPQVALLAKVVIVVFSGLW
jgi:hypothetical protein